MKSLSERSAPLLFLLALGLFFPLYGALFVGKSYLEEQVQEVKEEISIHNDLLSGKAQYLPGAACVIAANGNTTPAQIVNFARACARSHEIWLESNSPDNSGEVSLTQGGE